MVFLGKRFSASFYTTFDVYDLMYFIIGSVDMSKIIDWETFIVKCVVNIIENLSAILIKRNYRSVGRLTILAFVSWHEVIRRLFTFCTPVINWSEQFIVNNFSRIKYIDGPIWRNLEDELR